MYDTSSFNFGGPYSDPSIMNFIKQQQQAQNQQQQGNNFMSNANNAVANNAPSINMNPQQLAPVQGASLKQGGEAIGDIGNLLGSSGMSSIGSAMQSPLSALFALLL